MLSRDYFRKNNDALIRYSNLKRELANRLPTDRDSYTDGKSDLISSIVAEAEKNLTTAYNSEFPKSNVG